MNNYPEVSELLQAVKDGATLLFEVPDEDRDGEIDLVTVDQHCFSFFINDKKKVFTMNLRSEDLLCLILTDLRDCNPQVL